jgi:DNA-binding SARP family transcriptional activator
VQVYVSQLRRALEPARFVGAPAAILVTRRPGYVLHVAAECYDAHRFEALATRAHAALSGGDPATASRLLDEALGLWRGDALAGIADHHFVTSEVARLEGLRLAAIEDPLDAHLALGRHAALVPELEGLVGVHPLRERLWGQLLIALYRSGRQADALAAFQRFRALLIDELGVEPGPDLAELESAILRHDPALAMAADTAAPTTPRRLSHLNLPLSVAPPQDEQRLITILDAEIVGLSGLGKRLEPSELSLDRGVGTPRSSSGP